MLPQRIRHWIKHRASHRRWRCCSTALLLVACTAPSLPAATSPPSASDLRGSTLIALLYEPWVLVRAERLVTSRCMREAGFPYPDPPSFGGAGRAGFVVGGALIVRRAQRSGYALGSLEGLDGSGVGVPNALDPAARRALSPRHGERAHVVIDGIRFSAPRRGCVASGRAAVYGSVRSYLRAWYWPQVLRAGLLEYLPLAVASAEVRAAQARYSRCMTSAGYAVRDPRHAHEIARSRFSDEERKPSAAEVRMAVADARCQRRSEIYETVQSALLAEGDGFLLQHDADLRAMLQTRRRVTVRAVLILASAISCESAAPHGGSHIECEGSP